MDKFVSAIIHGNVDFLSNVNPNYFVAGDTLLGHALRYTQPRCVELLLDRKANVMSHQFTNYLFNSPSCAPRYTCLRMLLQRFKPKIVDIIHSLVFTGDVHGLQTLSDMKADLTQTIGYGETALHICSRIKTHHSCDVMEFLIRKKADINMKNPQGKTPIQMATAHYTHMGMTKLLLEAKADVDR